LNAEDDDQELTMDRIEQEAQGAAEDDEDAQVELKKLQEMMAQAAALQAEIEADQDVFQGAGA